MSFSPLIPQSTTSYKQPPLFKQLGTVLKSKRVFAPSDSYGTTVLEHRSRMAGKSLLNFIRIQLHLFSCQRCPSALLPIAEPCVFIDNKWLKFYFPRLNKPKSSNLLLGHKLPIFPVTQAACLCSSLSLTFASGGD